MFLLKILLGQLTNAQLVSEFVCAGSFDSLGVTTGKYFTHTFNLYLYKLHYKK